MPPRDFLEELELLRQTTRIHEDGQRSLAAYLKGIAEGIERGLPPNRRLAKAEAALEAALGLLAVYQTAHPDDHLTRMSDRMTELVDAWRAEHAAPLIR